jgi:hypothetical protein
MKLWLVSLLVCVIGFGCARQKTHVFSQTQLDTSAELFEGPVCGLSGWKGLEPERWDEMSAPDGESFACDAPKPADCGSDCDGLWHWQCETLSTYPNPVSLQWWDFTGPDRTWHDPGSLLYHYYPCVYFCDAWVWTMTKCKWACTDGDECCLTTCNNLSSMYGDADGDGDVDLADYAYYQRYIGNQQPVFGVTAEEALIVRTLKEGRIDALQQHRLLNER